MTKASPAESAPPETDGIVCAACGKNRWKVIRTQPAWWGAIRRWRRCLGCRAVIRTRETVETGPHPDRDAA